MVRARVRLCMKADRSSNLPTKLGTATLKTTAVGDLRLELRNHFQGLKLDEDASPEDEW